MPNEAGEIMAEFMPDNPIELITDYAFSAARRSEYAKIFGADNSKLKNMLDAMKGASKEDVDLMKMAVQAATGRIQPAGSGWQSFQTTTFTLGNMALLSLATLSSLPEAMSAGLRSGYTRDAFSALAQNLTGLVRRKNTRELHELARTIGLIMPYATDTLMQNRLGADVMNGQPLVAGRVGAVLHRQRPHAPHALPAGHHAARGQCGPPAPPAPGRCGQAQPT
ncbi:hypothetical protein P7F88_25465 [Vibrio hannami]|uniref:hypothetical protein n=1 Tax=Vibrio hannami TaxID=2717094 RepID=UPI002410739D|nr:hypothetical protein [Vibrio hannami]MDG3089215.1 hypothetical protein [Vibrio hannami]